MSKKETEKYYVDDHVVRLVALQVVILTVVVLATEWKPLLVLLAADFALRAFTFIPAPLALIAKAITRGIGMQPKPIFAAPKKFAAALGFIFSLTILVFLYLNIVIAAYITGIVLLFCAVLESVFKICLGCYVYNWLVAPIINARNK